MTSYDNPLDELDQPAKKKIQRRHGACEPCRLSKTKCDGRVPCGACRSERRRQCPCVYSEKAMKLQQVTAESRRQAEKDGRNCDNSLRPSFDDDTGRSVALDDCRGVAVPMLSEDKDDTLTDYRSQDIPPAVSEMGGARMSHALSACAAIEEFKRLKPARGYSAQVVSRCDGFEVAGHTLAPRPSRDSPFPGPSSLQPEDSQSAAEEIQYLNAKLERVDEMIRDGHLAKAWASLATMVRQAQLIQAEATEDPSSLVSIAWRRLWNTVLDLEAQVGLILGRPIEFVPFTRSDVQSQRDGLSLEDTLDETRTDLHRHIQGMLDLDVSSNRAIRDFLERARDVLDHEPFSQIGLCTTDGHSAAVRDLHLNTHLLFMVIYGRMAALCDLFSRDLTNGSWSDTPAADIIRRLNLHRSRKKLQYSRLMFRSATFVVDSFMTLSQTDSELTATSWLRCHSAYIAATVLGIAKLRHEVEWHATTDKLRRLGHVFAKLSQAEPRCHLFSTAVDRLQDLGSVKEPASEATRIKHTGIKKSKRSAPSSGQPSPRLTSHPTFYNTMTLSPMSPMASGKRTIDMVDEPVDDNRALRERFMHDEPRDTGAFGSHLAPSSSFEELSLDPLSFFTDNSATYSQSGSSFTTVSAPSSATSFSESELPLQAIAGIPLDHPGPPFAYPFPYDAFHPPMAWNNPVFTIANQPDDTLVLHLPIEPHYGSSSSTMTEDIGSQYSIRDDAVTKESSTNSSLCSPLQLSSGGTMTTTGMSPNISSNLAFTNTVLPSKGVRDHGIGGRSFSQQLKIPLAGSEPSHMADGPSLNQRPSANTPTQSSLPVPNDTGSSSIGWHGSSAIAVSHDMQPSLSTASMPMSETGRRASVEEIIHPQMSHHRHDQPGQYVASVPGQTTQPQQIMRGQFMPPGSVVYVSADGGMSEHDRFHGHYSPAQSQPYPRYFTPNPGQMQDSWRRMSFGKGGSVGRPY